MLGKSDSESWLIAGLGNPGPEYAKTRHNCGFRALDLLAQLLDCKVDKLKFQGLYGQTSYHGKKLFLLKPQTFMNESGTAVREAMSFYKIPLDHVLAVSDDVTLAIGKLRIRASGSAGGHNGLKDIIAKCGGEGFPRIRLGVGIPQYDLVDWVLSPFRDQDALDIQDAASRAAHAVETIITQGISQAQNKFN